MGKKPKPLKFDNFEEFYNNVVSKLKHEHPEYIRLDGKMAGSTRHTFAYFNYQNKCWKIDADTWIEKLDIVNKILLKNQDPFLIIPTKGNKNQCLTIAGEAAFPKNFYVYLNKF